MKYKNIFTVSFAALTALTMLVGCVQKEFEEITELSLARCLEPQKLYARVDAATGDNVTFGWDVNKDAGEYELVVYTDEGMTAEEASWTLSPEEVPFTTRLTADQKYWFTVQAYKVDAEGAKIEKTVSNLAVYDGNVKTRAVKDNLFLEVTARTASSFSLAWSNELVDFEEVTHIEATPVGGGKSVRMDLTDAMAKAAAATIDGLEPSTEYQVVLYFHSASRGALDMWTMAESGSLTVVRNSDDLLAIIKTGGEAYLTQAGSPYTIGGSKPTASLKLVGEMGADGSKPVVIGNFDIGSDMAANSNIYVESVKFDDGLTHNHLINYSGEGVEMGKIQFVNCEITGFKAGLFYNNKGMMSVDELSFDSCDMYENATTLSGDCIDVRKAMTFGSIKFVNCTLYDGFRSLFRIDKVDGITIGEVVFENNTVKSVAAVDHKDNRGLFAFRVPTRLSLKKNLFLYETTGLTGYDESTKAWKDRCQLFQVNDNTVVPELSVADNYVFGEGDAFFQKVKASEAAFTVLKADPTYRGKSNLFYLVDQELQDKSVGASKWQIPYEEKVEDLTQHFVEAPHVWNLQDAKLFNGDVKSSRVRDELLLVGTEETPMNADGGINFLSASPRTRKGVPTEGYATFKVNAPGSVDILVADPNKGGGTVVIALSDDNGFVVQGGAAASASNPSVQKVVIPKVTGEGTVYLFATSPAAITKLAWSADVKGGNPVLATPKLVVEPVTVTEGEAVAVSVSWDAVDHAVSYELKFNKKTIDLEDGAMSYTVPADDIAALEAGLYNFTIQAFPEEGDIYYQQSQVGTASIAIQPTGGSDEVEVEKTITWDFSSDEWFRQFISVVSTENTTANFDFTMDGLTVKSSSGKWRTKSEGLFYLQLGTGSISGEKPDHYFKFTAPGAGKLKITAANTGSSNPARSIYVVVNGADPDKSEGITGTTGLEKEFDIPAGEVYVYPGDGGLSFYKIELTYMEKVSEDEKPSEDHLWDFSSDEWLGKFQSIVATENTAADFNFTMDGLTVKSSSGKWRKKSDGLFYLQTGTGSISGEKPDHYFQFTVGTAGKLTITAANTGGSNAARAIYVVVNGSEPDKSEGITGTTGLVKEFDIAAGEVYVYPGDGGLSFYKIEFHSK